MSKFTHYIFDDKEIFIFDSLDDIAKYVCDYFIKLSSEVLKNQNRFSVALSGGNTPINLYKKLAESKEINWNNIDIFQVDERFVPPNHPDNNYNMIKKVLLDNIKIPSTNIHKISVDKESAEKSAREYEQDIVNYFQTSLPSFDLILLGIGDDGHTASLFPDTPELNEKQKLCINTQKEYVKHERISMTLPLINNAKNISFLVSEKNKSQVLQNIITNRNCLLPAAKVKLNNNKIKFFIDKEAASCLNQKSSK